MIFPILLLLTSGIFAAICWRDLKLGIYLVLFALPTYLVRFHIGPIPSTLLEVFVLITIVVFTIRRTNFHSPFAITNFQTPIPIFLPIALLLLAATIGVIVSPNKLSALGEWKAYFVEPIVLFFVIRSTFKTKTDVDGAQKALGCSALAVSVFGIIQYLTGLGIPAPWDIERRITSVFGFPNAVGLFLGPIVTMAIILLFQKYETEKPKTFFHFRASRFGFVSNFGFRISDLFWLFVLLLSSTAIFLAQTEAAYVAIPASLFIVWVFSSWKKYIRSDVKRSAVFLPIMLTVLIVICAFVVPAVRQKLFLQDYSGQVRLTQWSETIAMLKEHPIFGAGLAGYQTVFAPYHHADWIEIFQYPHNIVLNIWSELGLLGLIAFTLLAYRVIRSTQLPTTSYQLLLLAALLEMTIHGLVDVPYFKNDLAIMTWTFLALLITSQHLDQSSSK